MKKALLSLLTTACLTLILSLQGFAQSNLIYFWNFNTFTATIKLPAVASLAADYAINGLDTAKARVTYAPIVPVSASYASYADFVAGDTTNARMGAAAGNGFRARNPSDSMQLLMYMPTTNFKNLQLKYACQTSSFTSGMLQQLYSYSLDSGKTWISSGTGLSKFSDTTTLNFSLYSIHVNDTNANNNRKFVFKMTFKFNNTGTSGNNRFDNITLEGDSINKQVSHTGVSPIDNASELCTLSPNPVQNVLQLATKVEGDKTIVILDVLGQQVYTSKMASATMEINTADLKTGLYYLHIISSNSGKGQNLKRSFYKL